MRLSANENFPGDAIAALRGNGYDVSWVREDAPGIGDPQVLAWAMREKRVLLTFDKDFGELAYRAGLPAACGVILFRIPMPSSADAAKAATVVLNSRRDWAGHFTVVEPQRIRMRPLPQAKH